MSSSSNGTPHSLPAVYQPLQSTNQPPPPQTAHLPTRPQKNTPPGWGRHAPMWRARHPSLAWPCSLALGEVEGWGQAAKRAVCCTGCSPAVKTAVGGIVRSASGCSVPRAACARTLASTRGRGPTSASTASGLSARPPPSARTRGSTPGRSHTNVRTVGERSHSQRDFAHTARLTAMTLSPSHPSSPMEGGREGGRSECHHLCLFSANNLQRVRAISCKCPSTAPSLSTPPVKSCLHYHLLPHPTLRTAHWPSSH